MPLTVHAYNSPLQGDWQVANVFINTETERTLNYQYNDDRLVGRFMSVNTQEITTTLPGGAKCISPIIKENQLTLDKWVSNTQSLPETGGAKAYELGIAGKAKALFENINCAKGYFANGDPGGNASFVIVEEKLLLNWTDGTIVLLKPFNKNIKPQASFDCANAGSASEKAICANHELAALDISVARSYQYYQKEAVNLGKKEFKNQLKSQQKAWLSQRNSCHANTQCLKNSMNDRLEILAHTLDGI